MLEAERLARSILEQAGEPIIVCDRDGIVIRASRAAARLAGQKPLFQAFDAVLPLRTADGGQESSLAEQAGRERLRGQEVRFDRADGASFSLILNAEPPQTAAEGVIGSVITLTDITRLKQAELTRETLLRDLEQAHKELATIESLSRAGLQLTTVDQLAHSIVSQVAMAMNADEVALLLVEDGRVQLAATVPSFGESPRPVSPGNGFVETIIKMRRSLFIEDARSSRLVTPGERARGNVSLLGAPLLEGEGILGALCVGWKDKHAADAGQQRFLEIIAARAALGISVANACRPARRRAPRRRGARRRARRRERPVAQQTGRLRAPAGTDDALHQLALASRDQREVLELMHERLDLRAATIYAVDDEAGVLRALALIGFPDEIVAIMQTLPIDDESTTGRVVFRDSAGDHP